MKQILYFGMILVLFSTFIFVTEDSSACLDQPSGLVSWWPGDGNALDIIGPNDGNLENGATYAPGKVGQAFNFDGVDDYVQASGTNIDDLQQLTIDAWVMHNSFTPGQNQRYVTLSGEKAVLRYEGGVAPGRLHFYMRIDGVLYHTGVENVLQIGVFHHVAGTYDGSIMRLYLDGEEVDTLNVSGDVDAGADVELGSESEPLDGLLDEVEIYDRALSASEIQDIYDADTAGKCKPIANYYIEYWHLSNRVYQDGRELNRLSFALRDDLTGEYPAEDIVASVELIYHDGTSVPSDVQLDNLSFFEGTVMYGGYDAWSGQWLYGDFEYYSGHSANVLSELIPGRYHLTITDTDGNTYESDYQFNGLVGLPIIPSHSFRTCRDKFGNFIWEWKVPYNLDPTLETSVRAIILIHDWKYNYVAELYTSLPTHLGRLFVPNEVLKRIPAQGNRFELQIQLRTNDQNNRSYSKNRRVRRLKIKR